MIFSLFFSPILVVTVWYPIMTEGKTLLRIDSDWSPFSFEFPNIQLPQIPNFFNTKKGQASYSSSSSSSNSYADGPSQVFVAWISGEILNYSSGGSTSTNSDGNYLTVTSNIYGPLSVLLRPQRNFVVANDPATGTLVERSLTAADNQYISAKQQEFRQNKERMDRQFKETWAQFRPMAAMAPMAQMRPMQPMTGGMFQSMG